LQGLAYCGASFDSLLQTYNLGYENFDGGFLKCSRGPHLARRTQVPHTCFTSSPLSLREFEFKCLLNAEPD